MGGLAKTGVSDISSLAPCSSKNFGVIQGRSYKVASSDICFTRTKQKLGKAEYCLEPVVKGEAVDNLGKTDLGSAVFFDGKDNKVAGIVNNFAKKDNIQYLIVGNVHESFAKIALGRR